jgi:hypothetical protein
MGWSLAIGVLLVLRTDASGEVQRLLRPPVLDDALDDHEHFLPLGHRYEMAHTG